MVDTAVAMGKLGKSALLAIGRLGLLEIAVSLGAGKPHPIELRHGHAGSLAIVAAQGHPIAACSIQLGAVGLRPD